MQTDSWEFEQPGMPPQPGETKESLQKDQDEVALRAQAQDEWLDAELLSTASAGATHTFVFTHIPPFIFEPDEPKGYFTYEPSIRQGLLERMSKGGVSKWWCGHYHRNAGGWYCGLQSKCQLLGKFSIENAEIMVNFPFKK